MKKILVSANENVYLKFIYSILIPSIPLIQWVIEKLMGIGSTGTNGYLNLITPVFTSAFLLLIAWMLRFMYRAFKEMEEEVLLSKLFNQVLFEEQFQLEKVSGIERNRIIENVKARFQAKVIERLKSKMLQPEIEKMVSDYFVYHTVPLPII